MFNVYVLSQPRAFTKRHLMMIAFYSFLNLKTAHKDNDRCLPFQLRDLFYQFQKD